MLGGGLGGGGGLFGTPQGGLGRGAGLGGATGGLGAGAGGGGLFGNRPGGLFGATGATTGQTTGLGVAGGGGLFGATPAASQAGGGGLFSNTATGVGLGAGTAGGAGLFQSPQTGGLAQSKFSTGGLFGPSPAASQGGGLFPQQNPGAAVFKSPAAIGVSAATGTGLGGLSAGGLFGAGGGMGAGLGTNTQGTPLRFEPVEGQDTVVKNGLTHNIKTHIHCISAMRQYGDKSLEELHFEDYAAGRKGATATGLGTGLLGNQGIGLGLNANTGGGLFGQNKTIGGLGGTSMAGGGLFGQTPQLQQTLAGGGLFGQQKPAGGGGLFTQQKPGLVGGGGAGGVLGGAAGGGLFGPTSQATGGLFNQTQTAAGGGLFNQTTGGLGGLGTQNTQLGGGGLFANRPAHLGTGGLGGGLATSGTGLGGLSTGLTGLGTGLTGGLGGLQTSQAGALGGGLFNKTQPSLLGNTSGFSLGQPGQLGGGAGLQLGAGGGGLGASGLGGLAGGGLGMQRGGGLGLNTGGLGGGTALGAGLAGQNAFQQSSNLGQSALQTVSLEQQQAHFKQQLEILANAPFGDSPLFRTATSQKAQRERSNSSTPVTSKTTPTPTPHYKLQLRPMAKFQVASLSSPSRHREKQQLFEGLDDSSGPAGTGGGGTFVPRKSIKKLEIRPKTIDTAPLPDSTSPPHTLTTLSYTPPTITAPTITTPPPLSSSDPLTRPAFVVSPSSQARAMEESFDSPELTLGAYQKPIARRPLADCALDPPATDTHQGKSPQGKSPVGLSKLTRDPLEAHRTSPAKLRPSAVVCSSPDYYTVPPLDELDSLVEEGGLCEVEGFTVGRTGYGEVHFPGNTNVYGLNIDQLVVIGLKEVSVYPEDVGKPVEGAGLNKRAVVTLNGNWPLCKTSRQPIKDSERLERMGYVEKLRKSTAKIGAMFCDYHADTGACVFEVDHFSKYKLADDDSEGEDGGGEGGGKLVKKAKVLQAGDKPQPAVPAPYKQLKPRPHVRLDLDEDMSDEEHFHDAQAAPPLGSGPLPPSQQLVSAMGVSTHRVQVMKASFFADSSPSTRLPRMTRAAPRPARLLNVSLLNAADTSLPSPISAAPDEPMMADVQNFEPPPSTLHTSTHPPPLPSTLHTAALQAQSAVYMAKHDLCTLVPLERSVCRDRLGLVADMGLTLGRSFRVGWAPHWLLCHAGQQLTVSATPPSSLFSQPSGAALPIRAVVEKVNASSVVRSEHYKPFLLSQLEHSDITINEEGIPHCSPQDGTALLHALALAAVETNLPSDAAFSEQFGLVLQLAVALWGDLPPASNTDTDSYAHQLARRKAVAAWLRNGCGLRVAKEVASAQDESEGGYLRAVFSLVSGQQLGAACQLAHERRDHKLALLLSQAGHNSRACRSFLQQQLTEWEEHRVIGSSSDTPLISKERQKLYHLLAGLLVVVDGDGNAVVNVCEGLDWKRAFALYMCFACGPTAPVGACLQEYQHALESEETAPFVPPPLPPYLEAPGELADTCYHLLQLHSQRQHSLDATLDPAASSPTLLDYRISWHLWAVLSALGYTHMHASRRAALHCSFAWQLERAGLWQWAVFPLLHLADPILRHASIQSLLERSCCEDKELSAEERFVVERLRLPVAWVHRGKAAVAHYCRDFHLEAWHLLEAGEWDHAHRIIIEHLAAEAIISDDAESLRLMLAALADPAHSASVQDWDTAGSVYNDFLGVSDKLQQLSRASEVDQLELEAVLSGLSRLVPRLPLLPCPAPREILCQADMAKKTATFTKMILGLKGTTVAEQLELAHTLSQLPMPSDYALSEYRSMLQPYIHNLSSCY